MQDMIRKATVKDLDQLEIIYEKARQFMRAHGNFNQWIQGHPNRDDLMRSLRAKELYVVEINQVIQASFVLMERKDPTYAYIEGSWLSDAPYVVLHKVATRHEIKGMGTCIIDYAKRKKKDIRMDTHKDNYPMQNLLKKTGFVPTGIIYVEDGTPRIAYQYVEK